MKVIIQGPVAQDNRVVIPLSSTDVLMCAHITRDTDSLAFVDTGATSGVEGIFPISGSVIQVGTLTCVYDTVGIVGSDGRIGRVRDMRRISANYTGPTNIIPAAWLSNGLRVRAIGDSAIPCVAFSRARKVWVDCVINKFGGAEGYPPFISGDSGSLVLASDSVGGGYVGLVQSANSVTLASWASKLVTGDVTSDQPAAAEAPQFTAVPAVPRSPEPQASTDIGVAISGDAAIGSPPDIVVGKPLGAMEEMQLALWLGNAAISELKRRGYQISKP